MATPIDAHVDQDTTALSTFLSKNVDVRFIRLQWLDYTNMIRCRVVVRAGTVHQLAQVCRMVDAEHLALIEDEAGHLEYNPAEALCQSVLIPDWYSLHLCPWAPGHASVQCNLGKYESALELRDEALIFRIDELCPRFALRKAVLQAEKLGVVGIYVGFEINFCVENIDSTLDLPPYLHSAYSMNTLENFMLPVMDEIVMCLQRAGVPVLVYHAGSHEGRYKITIKHVTALKAADMLVFTRQVIRNVCKKHSLVPAFHRWWPGCNVVHTNISLIGPGYEDSFLAGILEHLGAIFAFALPLPISYQRVVAGQRQFGRFEAWGYHNREVPIRRRAKNDWQLRCVDATANIYLVLAAVIISGTVGMKQKSKLTVKNCQVDPETLSPVNRRHLGITRELPSKLEDAHSSLEKDRVLNEALGGVLVEKFLHEMTNFADILGDAGSTVSDERLNLFSTNSL
ncbi:hypothetical protein F5Y06DRAFT_274473 [Hypoxylon sp. FL0890]|nr:hypothetical protein F5Y06DRAFT_274473 [Hypoxylon sp. FL0890]